LSFPLSYQAITNSYLLHEFGKECDQLDDNMLTQYIQEPVIC